MRLIDLSHRLQDTTPPYPGDEPARIIPIKTLARDGYAAFSLRSGMHTGTHVDMPMHLVPDTKTVADFDPSCFAGEGILLDARGRPDSIRHFEFCHLSRIVLPCAAAILYTQRGNSTSCFPLYKQYSLPFREFFLYTKTIEGNNVITHGDYIHSPPVLQLV